MRPFLTSLLTLTNASYLLCPIDEHNLRQHFSNQTRFVAKTVLSHRIQCISWNNSVPNLTLPHPVKMRSLPQSSRNDTLHSVMISKKDIVITKDQAYKTCVIIEWVLPPDRHGQRHLMNSKRCWPQKIEDCSPSHIKLVRFTEKPAMFRFSPSNAFQFQKSKKINRRKLEINLKLCWHSQVNWVYEIIKLLAARIAS